MKENLKKNRKIWKNFWKKLKIVTPLYLRFPRWSIQSKFYHAQSIERTVITIGSTVIIPHVTTRKFFENHVTYQRDLCHSRDLVIWLLSRDINAKLTFENVLWSKLRRHVKIKFHLSLFDLYCKNSNSELFENNHFWLKIGNFEQKWSFFDWNWPFSVWNSYFWNKNGFFRC